MGNEVGKGTPGARIIAEEERLYGQVQARVALGDEDDGRPQVGAGDLDADLVSLRDQIAEARPEDLPPLVEQMTRLAALRARLGGGRQLPVDITSPYFAHIRLREHGKRKDVLVGKRGFIDRQSNVQIVDWRNAPVSRIYYRYEEGDDYEEEIAGRRVEGMVEVRRNISIARGALRRIGAPQGTYLKDARGGWVQAVGQLAPVLHGGMGKAARPAAVAGAKGTLGIHHGAARADKALPEIAALIDKEQFELITQPSSGIVVIQGGAGSGKTTVALHRIAYLNFQDPRRFKPSATLFVVPSQALVRYVSGVLPSLGVSGVPVVTYTGWARTTRMRCLPDSPTSYNAEPPEQVSRVKKHPALLRLLEDHVARQAAHIGAELTAAYAGALAEWDRLARRALVPRLAGIASWLKRADLPPASRVALEGVVKRWKKRADDVVVTFSKLVPPAVDGHYLSFKVAAWAGQAKGAAGSTAKLTYVNATGAKQAAGRIKGKVAWTDGDTVPGAGMVLDVGGDQVVTWRGYLSDASQDPINSPVAKIFNTKDGKHIYDWLTQHAPQYGFCQVYSAKGADGRATGYEEEKWHWSYMPVASWYLKQYPIDVGYDNIKGFDGSTTAKDIDVIKTYVQSINPECKTGP